jgi:SAM-dependent methyltransferase
MTSTISKYNLDKDKKVLGKKWFTTYSGWFSDEDNIQSFIKTVTPYLSQKSLDILYVASASGLLGERLLEYLKASKLTIVDMSQKHLNENKNRNTIKIKTDILGMNLKKKFDVILMRSSLDYFPSKSLQIKVLKIIKKHLKSDGIFINQPAYIPDIKERDIISSIYNQNKKIGKRLFQSTDIESIYQKAGFSCPQKNKVK